MLDFFFVVYYLVLPTSPVYNQPGWFILRCCGNNGQLKLYCIHQSHLPGTGDVTSSEDLEILGSIRGHAKI